MGTRLEKRLKLVTRRARAARTHVRTIASGAALIVAVALCLELGFGRDIAKGVGLLRANPRTEFAIVAFAGGHVCFSRFQPEGSQRTHDRTLPLELQRWWEPYAQDGTPVIPPGSKAILDGGGFYAWTDQAFSVPGYTLTIVFPEWCALLVVLSVASWGLWPLWKARQALRRQARGLCAACGYDLRGAPGRCPECGMAKKDDQHVKT